MAGAAPTIATALSNLLAGLTPSQLGQLGKHLTVSNEMAALQIVDTMEANPALAPMLLPSLSMIPNLPPQALTWVSEAIGDPSNFKQNMAQAKAALQSSAVSPGLLGNLGL